MGSTPMYKSCCGLCVNYLKTIIFMRCVTGFLKEISEDSISVLLDKDLTQW